MLSRHLRCTFPHRSGICSWCDRCSAATCPHRRHLRSRTPSERISPTLKFWISMSGTGRFFKNFTVKILTTNLQCPCREWRLWKGPQSATWQRWVWRKSARGWRWTWKWRSRRLTRKTGGVGASSRSCRRTLRWSWVRIRLARPTCSWGSWVGSFGLLRLWWPKCSPAARCRSVCSWEPPRVCLCC